MPTESRPSVVITGVDDVGLPRYTPNEFANSISDQVTAISGRQVDNACWMLVASSGVMTYGFLGWCHLVQVVWVMV